jgi:DNA-binding transcriptional LysR family regulator
MELRHLRYFVAVAEEHSFTRAAERLGIKQPPLSLQIRQLEKEIGAPLFRRLSRPVDLTGAGKLLLEEARIILARVDRAKIEVKRRARGETGQMYIGMAGATYFEPLVGAINREYRATYPNVTLSAEESSSLMLIAKLQAGTIDAAFVRSPVVEHSDIAVVTIVEDDLVLMVPKGHALDRLPAVPLAALAGETLFLFARRMNAGLYDSIIAACQRADFQPNLGRELPHIFATFPVVAAGLGCAFVPRCLTRVHVDGVSFRPIAGEELPMRVSLAYRRDDQSAAVKNLATLARRMVRSGLPVKEIAQTVA